MKNSIYKPRFKENDIIELNNPEHGLVGKFEISLVIREVNDGYAHPRYTIIPHDLDNQRKVFGYARMFQAPFIDQIEIKQKAINTFNNDLKDILND